VKRIQARIDKLSEREIPRAKRRPAARPLTYYFQGAQRDAAITRAYLVGGHTQTGIAQATRLSVFKIRGLIAAHEAKGKASR
jgi:hypothetical protein